MNSLRLPCFAKLNLRLRILGKRPDGYHELFTIFQTVSLADMLMIESSSGDVLFECDDETVPTGADNIVVRAALALRDYSGTRRGARIRLAKRIPSPGGLGGGSSDAATALIGLATLWGLDIKFDALVGLAAELGSDVPFFLYGGTAAATGRGTEITPLADFQAKPMLIVTPRVDVSTAAAFSGVNAACLTKEDSKRILEICQNEAESFKTGELKLENDFEQSVFAGFPEIKQVRDRLLDLGADKAVLSGSGASVFAMFEKEETRQATMKALNVGNDWRMFAVAAITRDEFRRAFKECARLFPISF